VTVSSDPEKRARQEANLMVGSESPGTVGVGNQLARTHGLRSRPTTFARMVEEVPEIEVMFAAIVEAIPVRDAGGGLVPGDVLQAQALAMQGYQVAQAADYFASHPGEKAAGLALWSTLTERYARGLERLGIGAAARARLGVDVARGMSLAQQMATAAARSNEDDEGDGR